MKKLTDKNVLVVATVLMNSSEYNIAHNLIYAYVNRRMVGTAYLNTAIQAANEKCCEKLECYR